MEQKKRNRIVIYIVLPVIILAGLVVMFVINYQRNHPGNNDPTPAVTQGENPTNTSKPSSHPGEITPTSAEGLTPSGNPDFTLAPSETPGPTEELEPSETPVPEETPTPTPVPGPDEIVITWKNKALELAVRKLLKRQNGDILTGDVNKIEFLDLTEAGLDSFEDLEYLTELKEIRASWNEITDISPLSNLLKLEIIDLSCNYIKDITALAECTMLREANLGYNYISDVSALVSLEHLTKLDLTYNIVTDVSALTETHPGLELIVEGNRIPTPTPTPEVTPVPVISGVPDSPEQLPTPAVTSAPELIPTPEVTSAPEDVPGPEPTGAPNV